MRVEDFDYNLPQELIAQEPIPNRDQARPLVVHRGRTGLNTGSSAIYWATSGPAMSWY